MPSVRVEDDAFGDGRYDRLAQECGLADADHARGKMLRLWRQCTAERRYQLDLADVILVLGPRGPDALVAARLGVIDGDSVRIKGTKGRIEWLDKLRKNGKKGGRPRGSTTKTKRKPSGFPESNPLALVPALVPAPAREEEREAPAAPAFSLVPPAPDPAPATPDPAAVLAAHATAKINAATGRNFDPASKATLRLCRALVREKRTSEDVTAVVERKAAEWLGTNLADRVCPGTLLAADNFGRYLDEIRAGPPTRLPPNAPVGTANYRPTRGQVPISNAPRIDGEQIP